MPVQKEEIKRLQRKPEQNLEVGIKKTATYVMDLHSTALDDGRLIVFTARGVNWKPHYSVYQEVGFDTTSLYDGVDYDKALRTYKDVLLDSKGVKKVEEFSQKYENLMKRRLAIFEEDIKPRISGGDMSFEKIKKEK